MEMKIVVSLGSHTIYGFIELGFTYLVLDNKSIDWLINSKEIRLSAVLQVLGDLVDDLIQTKMYIFTLDRFATDWEIVAQCIKNTLDGSLMQVKSNQTNYEENRWINMVCAL
ncbi:hypothetical protein CAAN1_31S01024 [[Candida] anglica]|uniref:Uncharacterized protein n=1 Tax=[Candida] anglica TaxID=148631 RepID=A0ABP0EFE5_9ASCO